ncbi:MULTISPECIES: LytR/AlgR family response regulator transcription factor [Brochothrix]|uniref:DNA-binding response regulator n=1 Tax=Brochothrix thermosphacta TaxID=2756 RepID=A0A1D2LYM7_BROTH|nr:MULTISPECIES: LytTR family transcriptional regulator DNA-binding domain-containing protein [Brochothrix]ANZ97809.1 DNA-binding response regulator [Brochothrix thermosphacta]ATF24976.1 DNA-binding response regulator [Brochothrix thermosphacta]ATH84392.1 DNA-binding response regulator [Brochothrix thermosphacta]MBR5525340.1 LytTR family transcriptional regulator DNA-binding domain-containing protein [Brochothrix sp.]MDO7863214.1 LytTR family transcriptional regulator DNA-binding domain-contai
MNVLIVDDEPLAREELRFIVAEDDRVTFVDTAESVDEALEKMLDVKPTVIFLDIHLTNESGFDLAKKIQRLQNPPKIIFATAYDNHALEAFQVDAIGYILKPFDDQRIYAALTKVYQQLQTSSDTTTQELENLRIALPLSDRIVMIDPTQILFASVENSQLTIVLPKQNYQLNESLNWLEQRLDTHQFMRTHRSFIVNLNKITEIQPWFNHTYQLTLTNNAKIPVSRSFVPSLKKRVQL